LDDLLERTLGLLAAHVEAAHQIVDRDVLGSAGPGVLHHLLCHPRTNAGSHRTLRGYVPHLTLCCAQESEIESDRRLSRQASANFALPRLDSEVIGRIDVLPIPPICRPYSGFVAGGGRSLSTLQLLGGAPHVPDEFLLGRRRPKRSHCAVEQRQGRRIYGEITEEIRHALMIAKRCRSQSTRCAGGRTGDRRFSNSRNSREPRAEELLRQRPGRPCPTHEGDVLKRLLQGRPCFGRSEGRLQSGEGRAGGRTSPCGLKRRRSNFGKTRKLGNPAKSLQGGS